ncbi:MAG TPA: hypothetical protein VFH85_06660 [Gammaproteobacteria bacterium]|nr:hypothetical protein [Gammaproteobacteria bacterium]
MKPYSFYRTAIVIGLIIGIGMFAASNSRSAQPIARAASAQTRVTAPATMDMFHSVAKNAVLNRA